MNAPCRLCGEITDLCQSHFVPRFFFRWLKRTGAPYIRSPGQPNRRQQDGPKEHFLCRACEGRFSKWETWFAEQFFYPYLNEKRHELPYDERLYSYSLSLLWRVLRKSLDEFPAGEWFFDDFREHFTLAEREWREFLLGGDTPKTFGEIHLFLTDVGLEGDWKPVVGFNRYTARASDGTIACSKTWCVVYAKFARFVWFGLIEPAKLDEKDYENTLVEPCGGELVVPQHLTNDDMCGWLISRTRECWESYASGLSDQQSEKIRRDELRRGPAGLGSDLAACILADKDAITIPLMPEGGVGRNDRCPCGSGKKFKRCHGSGI